MEIQNTTSTDYTSHTTSNRQKSEQDQNSFLENIETTKELTYENIQELSKDDIKNIFSGDQEAQDKVLKLKSLSQFSNDSEFNKTLFNQAKDLSLDDMMLMSFTLNSAKNMDKDGNTIFPPKNLSSVEYGDNNPPILQFKNQEESLDFIKTIMNYLEQSYNNSKALNETNAMEKSSSFYNMFGNIQNNYTAKIEENENKLAQMRDENMLNKTIIENKIS